MRSTTEDDRRPAAVPPPAPQPVPLVPPICVTEALATCPHCGGGMVLVLEAQ
jgi:hypothetical protein